MESNAHTLWHNVRYLVLAGLALYIGFAILITALQSRMIYFPVREWSITPEGIGLEYDYVTLVSEDGKTLTGWYIPSGAGNYVILICHGNGGNISHRIETIRIFHKLGLSTFIFDYRGYGRSEGKPSEKGTYRDSEASWRYLVEERGISPGNIIIFGRSLGGAVAARLAMKHKPKALVLESSFSSVPDLGSQIYPWLPVKFLSRFDYPTISFLKDVTCPVLVVHSSEDDLIPFNHGQALFEAASEPKEFLVIHGSHNEGFLLTGKPYVDGLDSFISRYVSQ